MQSCIDWMMLAYWQAVYAEEEAVHDAYLAADTVGRKGTRGRWDGADGDRDMKVGHRLCTQTLFFLRLSLHKKSIASCVC